MKYIESICCPHENHLTFAFPSVPEKRNVSVTLQGNQAIENQELRENIDLDGKQLRGGGVGGAGEGPWL